MQSNILQNKSFLNRINKSQPSAERLEFSSISFKKGLKRKFQQQKIEGMGKSSKLINSNLQPQLKNPELKIKGKKAEQVEWEQEQFDLKQSIGPLHNNSFQQLIRSQLAKSILFDDDENIHEQVQQFESGKVQIALAAQRSQVKLGQQTVLPAMCKITTSGGSRTSLDLICVIDVSGSMSGKKLNLVKSTMKVLIEALGPSDRLSIITFSKTGKRLCPLKAVTQQNMVVLLNHINQLKAQAGTNIMGGMQLALKTIRDRKYTNKGTGVFLLSDGQDKRAENSLILALKSKENQNLGVFNIHSFGFGQDHDEDLMSHIANLKDGSFYYIQELNTLDEAFCSALGGMISLVAKQVHISVECVAKDLVKTISISKVYENKWEKLSQESYSVHLTQLMSDITKQFVFELMIPPIQAEVEDINREYVVVRALMRVTDIFGQQYERQSFLPLTLINQHEQIAEINQNVEVIESYLRVKAALAIKESLMKAQLRKFQQAQKQISEMIDKIKSNNKARPEKLSFILSDLQKLRLKCSEQDFKQARKLMVSSEIGFLNMNGLHFSNTLQSLMVQERKLKKSMPN